MSRICALFVFLVGALAALTPPASAQDPKPQVVVGTVWVVEDGVKRLPLSGTLHLCYFLDSAQGTYPMESQLVAGAFRFEFPAEAELREPGILRIEGRDAECQWDGGRADISKPIELEAHFIPESRLRARIRGTAVELARCTLSYGSSPSSSRTVALPYVFPNWEEDCPAFGWSRSLRLWATIPGHAWSPVLVDRLAGGDVWVELVPEAHLVLELKYAPEFPPQRLSLSGPDGSNESRELGSPEYTFDGLQPGTYRVYTFASGPGSHAGVPRATIQLSAGESKRVVVDLNPQAPKKRVAARGTVVVDPSWGKDFGAPRLEFFEANPPDERHAKGLFTEELTVESAPTAAGIHAWDAGRLPAGKHFVLIRPFAWGAEIDVPDAEAPIVLNVPPRVHCKVRVVAADTHEELDAESIAWRFGPVEFDVHGDFETVPRSKDEKCFAFDAPRGAITLSTNIEGFGWRKTLATLHEDPAEWTIALEPECRIRVRVKDGERVVALPERTWAVVRRPGGLVVENVALSRSSDSLMLHLEAPGTYEIQLASLEGGRQPAPIVVEARRREIVDAVFPLTR